VGQRRDCLAKLEGPRGASQPIFVGFGSKAENLKTSRFASKSGPPICTLMSTRPSGCLKSRDSTQFYDGARTDDRCCRSVCAASSRHQRAFSTYLSRRSGTGTFLACSSQSAAWARYSSALDRMGLSMPGCRRADDNAPGRIESVQYRTYQNRTAEGRAAMPSARERISSPRSRQWTGSLMCEDADTAARTSGAARRGLRSDRTRCSGTCACCDPADRLARCQPTTSSARTADSSGRGWTMLIAD
jgi:hypothetical protein